MKQEIQTLQNKVHDFEEIEAARTNGIISNRLKASIKYKVTRFVFRVQANQSIENVAVAIDKATNDICRFIAQPEKAEEKNLNDIVLKSSDY